MSYPRNRSGEILAGVALAAVIGGTIAAAVGKTRRRDEWPPDSAPGRTARHTGFGRHAVVGRSVTINKPRAELYGYWRTFENLPAFMENVEEVRSIGPNRWRWSIAAPAGQVVDLETEVVEDRENEVIAWRSTAESSIEAHGRVTFRDAPAGRGTVVEAVIAYVPPAGEIGRLVAKLFQREPQLQVRRELKRFKMLMETGEIAISHNRRNAA
ncbi:MAG: SRPBCC family protein [Rhodospirillales bacterium]|nr:SRPBCC family protein [Rhodospirillales bacterium]